MTQNVKVVSDSHNRCVIVMEVRNHKLIGARFQPGHRVGGQMIGGPARLVIHTSEGRTGAGALDSLNRGLRAKNIAYHLGVDLPTRSVDQYVLFNDAASALRNARGGVETNRMGSACIQVCLTGRAENIHTIPTADLEWLGFEVFAPLMHAYRVSDVWATFVGPRAGVLATTTAKQRLTNIQWAVFNGVCGHQHVPENDHWDPGAINVHAIRAGVLKYYTSQHAEVRPMFDPPLRPIVAVDVPPGTGPANIAVADDGSVYLFAPASVPSGYVIGANGQSYFQGRKPARIEVTRWDNGVMAAWRITATSGETYNYPHAPI